MKLLFRGTTLCSDEPRDLSFRDFPIDTKIITHRYNSNIVLKLQNFGKTRIIINYNSLQLILSVFVRTIIKYNRL